MEFPAKNVDVKELVAKNEQFPPQNDDEIESRRQKKSDSPPKIRNDKSQVNKKRTFSHKINTRKPT
ncbi:hypothetical protein CQJ30_16210 [Caldibacillus thermoamylovorans]|nr:hypothetical protein CQJ30_16210 [Caldibacillus thermoamylovorans]